MASAVRLAPEASASSSSALGGDLVEAVNSIALAPEREDGNHEYKRQLLGVSADRFEELVTQLKWRCFAEGDGEALYELGVDDDGEAIGLDDASFAESLATLTKMADAVDCDCTVAVERVVASSSGARRRCATCLIRARVSAKQHKEIRVVTLGNVDSGKSTMLGVLTRGGLDNGRGLARGGVFRHKHELDSVARAPSLSRSWASRPTARW